MTELGFREYGVSAGGVLAAFITAVLLSGSDISNSGTYGGVLLGEPINMSVVSTATLNFTYYPTVTNGTIDHTELWTNTSGSWGLVASNASNVTNASYNYIGYDFALGYIWVSNSTIASGASGRAPYIYNISDSYYMIVGLDDGTFSGFNWYSEAWHANSTVSFGLVDYGFGGDQTVFSLNSNLYCITGGSDGKFYGYTWNGSGWTANSSIVIGLTDIGTLSSPASFEYDSKLYLISGDYYGDYTGFMWNGTQWILNTTIISGLGDTGHDSHPTVFTYNTSLYLISGDEDGKFKGFKHNGFGWVVNNNIIQGLSDVGSYSKPCVTEMKTNTALWSGSYTDTIYGWNLTIRPANDTITNKTTWKIRMYVDAENYTESAVGYVAYGDPLDVVYGSTDCSSPSLYGSNSSEINTTKRYDYFPIMNFTEINLSVSGVEYNLSTYERGNGAYLRYTVTFYNDETEIHDIELVSRNATGPYWHQYNDTLDNTWFEVKNIRFGLFSLDGDNVSLSDVKIYQTGDIGFCGASQPEYQVYGATQNPVYVVNQTIDVPLWNLTTDVDNVSVYLKTNKSYDCIGLFVFYPGDYLYNSSTLHQGTVHTIGQYPNEIYPDLDISDGVQGMWHYITLSSCNPSAEYTWDFDFIPVVDGIW